MSEFKLPEKWRIKTNKENWKVIFDWANFTWDWNYAVNTEVYYNKLHNQIGTSDYTEITFEQFEKYVLKKVEYTIEDLSKGLVVLYNPNKSNKVADVIKKAFPHDISSCFGTASHYRKDESQEFRWTTGTDQMGRLPIQHLDVFLKQLEMKKEFTIQDLTEGRCAVHNDGTLDELRIVLKAAFPNDKTECMGKHRFYQSSTNIGFNWIVGDTVITKPHQSVKTFIKDMSTTKKIIGYKLIKSEYTDAVFLITGIYSGWDGFKNNWFTKNHSSCECEDYDKYVVALEKAGVLNLWFEPIYEETAKIFKMTASNGNFELEVSEKGIYYRPDSRFLNSDDLHYIVAYENFTIRTIPGRDYSSKVKKIDVGCKEDTLISEWKEVLDYYKTIKKD